MPMHALALALLTSHSTLELTLLAHPLYGRAEPKEGKD